MFFFFLIPFHSFFHLLLISLLFFRLNELSVQNTSKKFYHLSNLFSLLSRTKRLFFMDTSNIFLLDDSWTFFFFLSSKYRQMFFLGIRSAGFRALVVRFTGRDDNVRNTCSPAQVFPKPRWKPETTLSCVFSLLVKSAVCYSGELILSFFLFLFLFFSSSSRKDIRKHLKRKDRIS